MNARVEWSLSRRTVFVMALLCLLVFTSCRTARRALKQNNDTRACLIASGREAVHPIFDDDEISVANAIFEKRRARLRVDVLSRDDFQKLYEQAPHTDYGDNHVVVRLRVEGDALLRLSNATPGDIRERRNSIDLVRGAMRYGDVITLPPIESGGSVVDLWQASDAERELWLQKAGPAAALLMAKQNARRAVTPCDQEGCGVLRLIRSNERLEGSMVARTGAGCEVDIPLSMPVGEDHLADAAKSFDGLLFSKGRSDSLFARGADVDADPRKRYEARARGARENVVDSCFSSWPQRVGDIGGELCGGCGCGGGVR